MRNQRKDKVIKLDAEKIRFVLVGSVNTGLDFGLLFLFKLIGVPIIPANLLSTGLSFVFSFFANRSYTFKSSNPDIRRQFILFTAFTLFGLWVLQSIVIKLTLPLLSDFTANDDLSLLFAKLLATIVSLTWNYFAYSKIVFKYRSSTEDEPKK